MRLLDDSSMRAAAGGAPLVTEGPVGSLHVHIVVRWRLGVAQLGALDDVEERPEAPHTRMRFLHAHARHGGHKVAAGEDAHLHSLERCGNVAAAGRECMRTARRLLRQSWFVSSDRPEVLVALRGGTEITKRSLCLLPHNKRA